MSDSIVRAYAATVEDVSNQERMVTARINTDGIDRFHTVIDPAGIDTKRYNKVVLWEHGKDPNRGSLPVGRNRWIRSYPGEIRARTQFEKDDYSQALFEMYRDGPLTGWSVRVLPEPGTFGPPTREEITRRPELAREWRDESGARCGIIVYRKSELAEYSAVAVPGNADAITLLESRGIWVPDDAKAPRATEVEEGDITESLDADGSEGECRYIRKKGEKWVVYSEAGQVLGTHDSEESAKKQLAAIEAHKHDKGRSLLEIRRDLADELIYVETRLRIKIQDLIELSRGRV